MKLASRYWRPLCIAAFATLATGSALAQTPAPAPADAKPPEPDWTLSANVGLFSQYVFRGITQTNEKPAIQGGFDLAHKSGFYVGTWASNISWLSDGNPDVSASMEWDFYGGYKWGFAEDWTLDLGVLQYYYPGSYPSNYTKPDTTELYANLSWKFLSVKYSYVVSNKTFGFPDSQGSYYIEGNAAYDIVDKVNDWLGKVTLIGHVGHQSYQNWGDYTYTDWKGGIQGDFSGYTVGFYITGTDANAAYYTNRFGKDTSETQYVGFVSRSF
ncbi:MAG: hypothetical protein JSR18_16440 [Proteobacteria bacterium]|nr:hypothetical protein [Pseudomonadota bacterium]